MNNYYDRFVFNYRSLISSLTCNGKRLNKLFTQWFSSSYIFGRYYNRFFSCCFKLYPDLKIDADGVYLFNSRFFFFPYDLMTNIEIDFVIDIIKNYSHYFKKRSFDQFFLTIEKCVLPDDVTIIVPWEVKFKFIDIFLSLVATINLAIIFNHNVEKDSQTMREIELGHSFEYIVSQLLITCSEIRNNQSLTTINRRMLLDFLHQKYVNINTLIETTRKNYLK